MSSTNAGAHGPPAGATLAPSDWIDSIAEAEGIDRGEAVKRLVSSYWTFKEVLGLIERAEAEAAVDPTEGRTRRPGASGGPRLDAAESLGAPHEVRAAMASLSARVDRLADRIDANHEALERRLDEEVGHSERIFSHLIERTEEIEADLQAIAEAQWVDRRRRESRRQLRAIRRTAGRRGIDRATCGGCGSAVSLGLLTAAECPRCSRPIEALEPAAGWLGSATLTVGEPRDEGDGAGTRGEDVPSEGTSEFLWGEDRE